MGCESCAIVGYVLAAAVTIGTSLYLLRRYLQGPQFRQPEVRLDGKVCIITGCNTGIGKETALELARRGGRVYMACRDQGRCELARQEVIAASGNTNVFNWQLDLSSLESVRAFVKKFVAEESRLDILINNAAIIIDRQKTADGLELQFATNHFGPFLLTNLLLDHLRNSAPSRIVTVSSRAHQVSHLSREDLEYETASKSKAVVYGRTKLANILFTRELARRLRGTGVTANCLHPGVVNTEIFRNANWLVQLLLWPILNMMKTTKSGAQTTITLALDPQLAAVSGEYFSDCARLEPAPQARDDEAAGWLWTRSEELCGLAASQ